MFWITYKKPRTFCKSSPQSIIAKMGGQTKGAKLGQIIRIEKEQLTKHLDKVVRGTVEDALHALLDSTEA